jgi:hypothetical protein
LEHQDLIITRDFGGSFIIAQRDLQSTQSAGSKPETLSKRPAFQSPMTTGAAIR